MVWMKKLLKFSQGDLREESQCCYDMEEAEAHLEGKQEATAPSLHTSHGTSGKGSAGEKEMQPLHNTAMWILIDGLNDCDETHHSKCCILHGQ